MVVKYLYLVVSTTYFPAFCLWFSPIIKKTIIFIFFSPDSFIFLPEMRKDTQVVKLKIETFILLRNAMTDH